jgi:hypothetical protein
MLMRVQITWRRVTEDECIDQYCCNSQRLTECNIQILREVVKIAWNWLQSVGSGGFWY